MAMRMACGEELASLGKLAAAPREWGELRRAHHPALPRCYAAGIRLALEVEILGISCGFLVHYPGRSRFTFSWMRPPRTVSQAKEGGGLSTETLPRNHQLIPKIYNEERKEQS